MEFKGSKSKWHIRKANALNENGKPLFYDICIEDQSFLSTFRNTSIGETDETQLANAKLISCAPEMLEMLKVMHDNEYQRHGQTVLLYNIKELIFKATTI